MLFRLASEKTEYYLKFEKPFSIFIPRKRKISTSNNLERKTNEQISYKKPRSDSYRNQQYSPAQWPQEHCSEVTESGYEIASAGSRFCGTEIESSQSTGGYAVPLFLHVPATTQVEYQTGMDQDEYIQAERHYEQANESRNPIFYENCEIQLDNNNKRLPNSDDRVYLDLHSINAQKNLSVNVYANGNEEIQENGDWDRNYEQIRI